MAFDDDFDVGSIIVLAFTPFHIIIVGIHIFSTFKHKGQ
ncbi:unnamed protein product [Angiostrongylus costaricensis]|uniref:Transmembrane protein n=1 Tax=Angiostrongylus costaricensis TaxID=334426 RepID=A0A0R3PCE7_ANGCS|nr:unnamed protein product [Angiostrongylus costaricensis]